MAGRIQLQLTEWQPVEVRLSAAEAVELRSLPARLSVEPVASGGLYRVTPTSYVGAVRSTRFDVLIQPKVGTALLFHMLGVTPPAFERQTIELRADVELSETMVRAFVQEARHSLRRGPLYGYRQIDETGFAVRGRVRFGDQIRHRYGLAIPVEIQRDDFTVDTAENRIVLAALARAQRFRVRDRVLRRRLHELVGALEGVSLVAFPGNRPPDIAITRLNRHYDSVLALARAILVATSAELEVGGTTTPAFLVDMNDVFERYVFDAVGQCLDLPLGFEWRRGRRLWLDDAALVAMKPDLSVWRRGRCAFVGDVKYKRTRLGENPDMYQLLAYCKAAGLGAGLLIYAEVDEPALHEVAIDGTSLIVAPFPLDGDESSLRRRAGEIAGIIREMVPVSSRGL